MSIQNINSDCLSNLARFSDSLLTVRQENGYFESILDGLVEIIGCSQASLMLFDSNSFQLKLMKVRGFKTPHYGAPQIKLTTDVAQSIYEGGEVLAPASAKSHQFLIIFDQDERKYFDCELRIPFFVKDRFIGVLNLGKKSIGIDYSDTDVMLLRILINMITLSAENTLLPRDKSSVIPTINIPLNNIQIKKRNEQEEIIGQSNAVQQVQHLIEKVAGKDVTVLITGESGTGKELVAKAIHNRSLRKDSPLVALNCAAIPENLVESELFGHEKGSFTGAYMQKKGKFEIADCSTLFLDEIGDMNLNTQAKMLRVLEEKKIQRIGSTKTVDVDVRIIVATHKNLCEEIKRGTFREDLYYRINVVQIHLLPLRQRREDIPLLAEYFFHKYNQFYCKHIQKIEAHTLARLMEYDFPGNIRELQNIIERAVILEQGEQLTIDFPLSAHYAQRKINGSLYELEKEHIMHVLEDVNFNKSKAARILGIARKTLREKMQKYEL